MMHLLGSIETISRVHYHITPSQCRELTGVQELEVYLCVIQVELKAEHVELIGACDAEKYPLQKKRHTLEFLRGIAHLRPRTNTVSSS